MSGLINSVFGDGQSETNVTTNTPPPSAEEQELIRLLTQLSQSQIDNMNNLQPLQREMLDLALADLRRQSERDRQRQPMLDEIDRLQLEGARDEAERAKRLGPIQDQIIQMQLANMRGELTPAQKAAADAAVQAVGGDIDAATAEGIGLISDELSNSRGLRLSDTPMLREATMLSKEGLARKASAAANIRAQALFQMPGQSAGIGLAQQQLASQATGFQAQLRQQAHQNRMSFAGQTMSGGLGLSSIGQGSGASALGSLSGVRAQNRHTEGWGFDPAALLQGYGGFMQGLGSMANFWRPSSDRRLKENIKRIGTLPNGIPVYRFTYLGMEDEFIGVMADEALKVVPEAVSKDEDGYYVVDYSKLH